MIYDKLEKNYTCLLYASAWHTKVDSESTLVGQAIVLGDGLWGSMIGLSIFNRLFC